jgi:predicted nuclease of restriction endonuclease-like (RecB) superfamily
VSMPQNALVDDIRQILRAARQQAYVAVNFAMVEAYWQIGKRIVEEEQQGKDRAGYGKHLITELSHQLSTEFGKGFTETNLWNSRQFYLMFREDKKFYALRRELTWTHYRMIMRVENPSAREYYTNEVAKQNWSTRQLERNIHSLYYERLLSSRDKQQVLAQSAAAVEEYRPDDFIKDPYVLEFLGLPVPQGFSEAEFETAIIGNLQHFLLELGKGFSFIGRQYRITTETKHFYIDLVFYNFLLKCFVLIDLKIGPLTHQDIGQMDMYVRLFEERVRSEGDNPSIGIIFCTEKDETVVRYSVLAENRQLFASKYRVVLPSEEELRVELEREKARVMEKMGKFDE